MKYFATINRRPRKKAALIACMLTVLAAAAVSGQTSISTLAGYAGNGSANGMGGTALFFNPQAVAVDSARNVYVADSGNNTIRIISPAGVSSTLAGTAGVSGSADGAGTNALFNQPAGIVVDGANNIYVSDYGNDTIRKITPSGNVTTIAGQAGVAGSNNFAGTNALFFHPLGIAVDSATNLYVADYGNQIIRKITPSLSVSTLAGTAGVAGFTNNTGTGALFNEPEAVTVDQAGNVYVADTGNGAIRKITSGGAVSTFAGNPGSLGSADGNGTNALFYQPAGIAINSASNIFVADYFNNTIRQISPAGAVVTLAGLAGTTGSADGTGNLARFSAPQGLAAYGVGMIYVADSANGTIRMVTTAAVVTTLAGSPSASSSNGLALNARFYNPRSVALDNALNIYVADTQNNVIRKITHSGAVSVLAGTPGVSGSVDGAGSGALFSAPQGVAVDNAGNVYVADTGNSTIRKVTSGGSVSTLAGLAGEPGNADGTGTGAQFSAPQGIAVDGTGNVFVADTWNHTIRKITAGGVSSTLAGLSGTFGSLDGTNTGARFNFPTAIAIDSSNNLYVTDYNNNTVRKVTAAGAVTTLAGWAGVWGSSDGTNTNALFYGPQGIALDNQGNIYVTDSGNDTVRIVSPSGANWAVTTIAGLADVSGSVDGPPASARFFQPAGMAFNSQGSLLVADSGNNTLRVSILPFLIYNLVVNPRPYSAIITWNTTFNATSQVDYGLTPAYGSFSSLTSNSVPSTNQAIVLTGLVTNSVYYFQAISTGALSSASATGSFFTADTLIMISSQAQYSGVWTVDSAAPDRYTNYYEFANTTNTFDTADATFHPNILIPGEYDVYIWYSEGTNRSANVPVTVSYNGGSTEASVNQTLPGGNWQLLASAVPFAAGTNGFIRIGNGTGETNKIVIADAIRLTYTASQDLPGNNIVPSWWASFFFGTNAVNSASDANGSGYSIYDDYILGISPISPDSQLTMTCQPIPGGVEVIFAPVESGRVYQLLSSSGIINPVWTNLNLSVVPDNYGNGTFTVTNNGAAAAFYRLSVQMPQ